MAAVAVVAVRRSSKALEGDEHADAAPPDDYDSTTTVERTREVHALRLAHLTELDQTDLMCRAARALQRFQRDRIRARIIIAPRVQSRLMADEITRRAMNLWRFLRFFVALSAFLGVVYLQMVRVCSRALCTALRLALTTHRHPSSRARARRFTFALCRTPRSMEGRMRTAARFAPTGPCCARWTTRLTTSSGTESFPRTATCAASITFGCGSTRPWTSCTTTTSTSPRTPSSTRRTVTSLGGSQPIISRSRTSRSYR